MVRNSVFGVCVLSAISLSAVEYGAGFEANTHRFDLGKFKAAQYSFESPEEFKFWTASQSKISSSTEHYKNGKASLRWDYNAGGLIAINDSKAMELAQFPGNTNRPSVSIAEAGVQNEQILARSSLTFIDPEAVAVAQSKTEGGLKFWVYSEKPQDGVMRIEGLNETRVVYTFEVKLQFKGWRAVYCMPSEDAKWLIPKGKIDSIRFVADTKSAGTLFFDRLELTDGMLFIRASDAQIFINPKRNGGMDQSFNLSKLHPPENDRAPSAEELEGVKIISGRLRNWLNGSAESGRIPEIAKLQASMVQDAPSVLKKFDAFNIQRHPDGHITGTPLFSPSAYSGLPTASDLLTQVLIPMAVLYSFPGSATVSNCYYKSPELLQKIILGLDHANDQGFTAGSAMGDSYGIQIRMAGYNMLIFLLKEELERAGILGREAATLKYYSHFNELYKEPEPIVGAADSLRGVAMNQLITIVSLDDRSEQVKALRIFTESINRHLAVTHGTTGLIKPDGTVYHHGGPYWMGYGNSGLETGTRIGYWLHGTAFALSEQSQQNLRKALLVSRFVSQKYDLPISLNGRWPFWGNGAVQCLMGFAYLADSSADPDIQLAGMFNRLYDENNPWIKELISSVKYGSATFTATVGNLEDVMRYKEKFSGVKPEPTPQGNLSLPFAASVFHRRGETMAAVRGNSKYVWDWECLSSGQLGRYLGRGSITVYTGSLSESGLQWKGWDWAHIPGTTAPVLSFAQLDPIPIKDASRHFTDQGAVGGMSFGDNGAFMMRFADTTYDKTLAFDQTLFFVDRTILVLGNNIRSKNPGDAVHTTVFQRALRDSGKRPTVIGGEAVYGADYAKTDNSGALTVRDSCNIGYWFPDSSKLKIFRHRQNFPSEKYGRETGGEDFFELAYFDHGAAPKGDDYEYAILIEGEQKPVDYKVLRKDTVAHIVEFAARKLTVSAVFSAVEKLEGRVAGVSEAALVAITEQNNELNLTVAAVDFGKNWAVQKDKTVINKPNSLILTLNGRYRLKNIGNSTIRTEPSGEETRVILPANDGAATTIQLEKI